MMPEEVVACWVESGESRWFFRDAGFDGTLQLRRAGPADAAAVRALTRAAYAKWVPIIGREPLPMTADYDHAVRHHWIDLHEPDGALAGLIEMIPRDDHLLIENLAVSPTHQGKGLGAMLLQHAEETAKSAGIAQIRLYTNAAFRENIDFYSRRGYAIDRHAPIPAGGIIVHMAKPLSGRMPNSV